VIAYRVGLDIARLEPRVAVTVAVNALAAAVKSSVTVKPVLLGQRASQRAPPDLRSK
jgi:hypothetical protein